MVPTPEPPCTWREIVKMWHDRDDPSSPPPSPMAGAVADTSAENAARVETLVAQVCAGQEEKEVTPAPPPPQKAARKAIRATSDALFTPPQKQGVPTRQGSAKRQTPTIHARKFAPVSRRLPHQPTQSPTQSLLGLRVSRAYTIPGNVGPQKDLGKVACVHVEDEHWGEVFDVMFDEDDDEDGMTFEELLLILAGDDDRKAQVSAETWALARGILTLADPMQAVRQFRRGVETKVFTGFSTLSCPDRPDHFEAKIQDRSGGKHHFAFHFPTRWGAAAAHECLARRLEFFGPGVKAGTRRNFSLETPWEALVGILIAGAEWKATPEPEPEPEPTPVPEAVMGTDSDGEDDGLGSAPADPRAIHEIVKQRTRKPVQRFTTDYVMERKPQRKRKSPPPALPAPKGKEKKVASLLTAPRGRPLQLAVTTRGKPRKQESRWQGRRTSSDLLDGGRVVRSVGKSTFFGVRWQGAVVKPGCVQRAKPWGAVMQIPGAGKSLDIGLGSYATAREAALVYDAEVRRREWEHVKPTNFAPPADPADVPQRHESSAGSLGPVMIEHIKTALSSLHNPIVAHRVTDQGNGVYTWRRAEVQIRYLIPTPKSPHMVAAEHHRWVLLKDVAGVLNGWDKLVDYIRKHKRQLEDVSKVGPDELPASAPLFTIFKRHYDSGQSAVCVLGGFEPYDPDGYPHHVVVCDGDTEDMSDNELRQELNLEPGAELKPRVRGKNSKNPYQEFCKATRPELLAADPAMTFAQVGKRLGELWRKKKAGGGDPDPVDEDEGRLRHRFLDRARTGAGGHRAHRSSFDSEEDDDSPLIPVKMEEASDEGDAGSEIIQALDRILREEDLTKTTVNDVMRRLENELPVKFNFRHHKSFLKEKIKAWVDEHVHGKKVTRDNTVAVVRAALPTPAPATVEKPANPAPTDEGLERAKRLFDRGILSAEDYDDVKLAWMNSLGGD